MRRGWRGRTYGEGRKAARGVGSHHSPEGCCAARGESFQRVRARQPTLAVDRLRREDAAGARSNLHAVHRMACRCILNVVCCGICMYPACTSGLGCPGEPRPVRGGLPPLESNNFPAESDSSSAEPAFRMHRKRIPLILSSVDSNLSFKFEL
eukprot:350259-Chlamydomonas_euryale.AAC.4